MKIGSNGLLRSFRAAFDYIIFYEVSLARHPWLVVIMLGLCIALPVAIMILGPRDWWLHPGWVLMVYAGVAAKYLWNRVRSGAPRVGKFEVNNQVREELKSAHSPEAERQAGFKRVNPNSGFDGPVILSDDFNALEMCDPNTDWPLTIHNSGDLLKEIVGSLKDQRVHFVNYGRQALLKSVLRNKALINEKKVAFAVQFPPVDETVSVFQTDYFTSLCSAERRLDDIVTKEGSDRHILRHAKDWKAVRSSQGMYRLPMINGNSPPMSLHIGIEIMGVSSDNLLRVAVQSVKTEFSRNMGAPLASGSLDWDDVTETPTLKAVIRNAARRELAEEWGAESPAIFKKLSELSPEPIGYFRNVLRLGKPQFVCLVRLNCKDHELSADASEVLRDARSSFDASDLGKLKKALDTILNHHSGQVDSAPLLGATHILRDLIDKRPDRIREILGY